MQDSNQDRMRFEEQQPESGDTEPQPASDEAEQAGQDESPEASAEAEQVERDVSEALEAVRQERDEFEQRMLRTAADLQNYRKRAEQNIADARQQQLMEVARGLLTVLDHFDHALEVDPEKTTTQDLLSGVNMVRDEFLRTLQRYGIERVEAEPGEPFDPNRHEAMMRQASDAVESNHVLAQLRPGYALKDKPLRPAQVTIAE